MAIAKVEIPHTYGIVAQQAEHTAVNRGVTGSIPVDVARVSETSNEM